MNESLSGNTKAILLLTAPLLLGRGGEAADILKPSEYRKLALRMREVGAQPADLLAAGGETLLEQCRGELDADRLNRLLGRGFLLSQAVERWQSRAIWVLSRADTAYPQRLKARLREDTPSVLYGCGDPALLEAGGLAVVGSREADANLLTFAHEAGAIAAQARRPLISGGARGVDRSAMRGALECGGRAVGVLADSLEKTAMNREDRNLLIEGRLVVLSPYDPAAGFNVGHAMQRNKLIYALADAALVVSAEYGRGGTWAGATEQLDKLRFVPLYVRATGDREGALAALVQKGAQVWPHPQTREALDDVIENATKSSARTSEQPELPLSGNVAVGSSESVREASGPGPWSPLAQPAPTAQESRVPADELLAVVRALVVRLLIVPRTAAEIALMLRVSRPQADAWLKQLVLDGVLDRSTKPTKYAVAKGDLFKSAPGRS